jgi:hypothetical protein
VVSVHDQSPAGALDLAERSAADLWQSHFLIASRGDSIRHNHLMVTAVLNEKCTHGCITAYLASRRPDGTELTLCVPGDGVEIAAVSDDEAGHRHR